MKLQPFPTLACALLAAAVACSTEVEQAAPSPNASEVSSASAQLGLNQPPLITGPVSPDGLQAIFATSDLGVGENRVGFALTSPTGLVREPGAAIASFFRPGDKSQGDPKQTTLALFRPWPYGTRGIYTTRLTFDAPGPWGIEISVLGQDGTSHQVQLFFQVKETTSAPAVGSPAVRSKNKTLRDVTRISELTTGSLYDADLYQTTIADAVTSGLPTVVVMASPAFCTNAVCGPQVEVLQELKEKYKGKANFIHVDFYDEPEKIQGDLSRARPSPTALEWRLPSTEWSFVIDRRGIISTRFEAFATLDELEQALQQVMF